VPAGTPVSTLQSGVKSPPSSAPFGSEPALTAGGAKRAAVRGSAITLAGFGASSVLRFISNLIITRLLVPEQFGIMALVNVFIMGLALFSDTGVGPNIIQSPRGNDPVFLNSAWTIQVIRGVIIWVAACLLAWPLSRFYARPELFHLLPVAALSALIGGLESTRLFTQNREMSLGRLSMVELAAQVTGLVVTLGLAALTHSLWALVFGSLVSVVCKTSLSHLVLPGEPNRFAWDAASRRAILDFGRWIFFNTATFFLASQSDRLVLGKLVSDRELGFYAIAVNLAALPGQIIGQLSQRVLYPIVAATIRSGRESLSTVRSNHVRLLQVIAPVIAMGAVLAAPAVAILYRRQYWEVGKLVSCLLIGTWLGAISASYGSVLMAAGRPKYLSVGSVVKAVTFLALVFFIAPRFGVVGVAIWLGISEIGSLAVAAFGWREIGLSAWKSDVVITLLALAYTAVCQLVYEAALRLFHGVSVPAMLVVVAMTGGVVWILGRRSKLF